MINNNLIITEELIIFKLFSIIEINMNKFITLSIMYILNLLITRISYFHMFILINIIYIMIIFLFVNYFIFSLFYYYIHYYWFYWYKENILEYKSEKFLLNVYYLSFQENHLLPQVLHFIMYFIFEIIHII